ncbi:MAG: hypothetical protein DNFNHJIP_00586 [Candidatus Argoarchaeum ethanivorans]|uniref:Uncharacterized protein n=1 Tax=Candidatus Argoarchaeum ethanivorans TaxID=2608793 RepID=A0A812A2N0_9EURY|nr:MAG: hypothetical protein DNFNHJIP_00586 [Candidatus Argoarchaeum ethanivorans]
MSFCLSENHRLFHPHSIDNEFYHYVEAFTFEDIKENNVHFLEDPKDCNESYYYRDFEHCYLFSKIFNEHKVDLFDLLQIDFVSIDYELNIETRYNFSQ